MNLKRISNKANSLISSVDAFRLMIGAIVELAKRLSLMELRDGTASSFEPFSFIYQTILIYSQLFSLFINRFVMINMLVFSHKYKN